MSRVENSQEMIECVSCKKIVVRSSTQLTEQGNYTCSNCAEEGKPAQSTQSWIDVIVTALQNLERLQRRRYYTESEIYSFIDTHWEQLCHGKSKTHNWANTIHTLLPSQPSIFEVSDEKFSLLKTSFEDVSYKSKRSKTQSVSDKKKKKDVDSPDKQTVDRSGFMWCHQCKQKHGQVIYCSQSCSKKYCTRCVERHYREKVDEIDQSQWVCYYCQGVCSCAFCRRRRAKETNTKFESHRGKKRRIVADISTDEQSTKKRKIKSLGNDSEEPVKEKGQSKAKDDWIVEDEDDEQPARPSRDTKSIRKRSIKDKLVSRRCRVTLKDLIDSKILFADDQLSFRNSDTPAILLQDGQIKWLDTVCSSLSTFAKMVAHSLGLTNVTLYNGWRVVYCRGKVMDQYRKQYRKILDSKKDSSEFLSENIEEDDDDDDDDNGDDNCDINLEAIEEKKIKKKNSDYEDDEYEEREKIRDSIDMSEDIIVKEESTDSVGESQKESSDLNESTADSGYNSDSNFFSPNNKNNRVLKVEKVDQQWWIDDEEEDVEFSPVHLLEDILFLNVSVASPVEADEQDILVIGNHYQGFLDIRDKDFFNVTSDEVSNIHLSKMSLLEDSHAYGETLDDDFYNVGVGIDTEYL